MLPLKACDLRLAVGGTVLAAFNKIAKARLSQIEANRRGLQENKGRDPEYLHQLRVAVRRLRSLCSDYVKVIPASVLQPLVADLKWLAQVLGPARDADVFAIEIWPLLRLDLSDYPLLKELDAQWTARQRAAIAKVCRALVSRRYQRFVIQFRHTMESGAWRTDASPDQLAVLDGAAVDFAQHVINYRNRKMQDCGRHLNRLNDAQLHTLRVRVKKFRYAADSFGSLFKPAKVHCLVAHVARLQDVLGAMHDFSIAEKRVATVLAASRGVAALRMRRALKAWGEERNALLRRQLRTAWRGYERTKKFW